MHASTKQSTNQANQESTKESTNQGFSVYKPVGHVVVSFEPQTDLAAVAEALRQAGFAGEDIVLFPAEAMRAQAEKDLRSAGPLASAGYEITLVRIHRQLAEEGYGFAVVRTPSDERIKALMAVVTPRGARYAQHYGLLVIEELIKPGPGGQQSHGGPEHGTPAEVNDSEAARIRAAAGDAPTGS